MSRTVLGLDQGAKTGWGIAPERGPVVRHGLARNHAERIAVVRLALELAGDARSLHVWFEQHDHMPLDRLSKHDRKTARKERFGAVERSTVSIIGQGKNYGRWLELLDMHGIAESHRHEVQPSDWRRRVHGVIAGDVKQAALDWATAFVGSPITDDNHAEGIGITAWAARDGLVAFDVERAQARIADRAKRAARKQGDLFGGSR